MFWGFWISISAVMMSEGCVPKAVSRAVVLRSRVPAEALARRVHRARVLDFEPSVADCDHELTVLCQSDFSTGIPDPVTRVLHYQATPAGVAACP